MGPVYAQPVAFEPQPLPTDLQFDLSSMDPGQTFDLGNFDNEEQLIQQWVVMEETGTGVENSLVDPELAASSWANMSSESFAFILAAELVLIR